MPHLGRENPAPLTPGQTRALLRAMGRQLGWGLHQVTCELRYWRARAERIPSAPIRHDAVDALARKRTHADGAALFAIVPDRRDPALLRLLVRYELILDFLDNVSERHRSEANGRELHLALVDAVDPGRPPSDYYRYHPWRDDGGYLRGLVESCQRGCLALPSFEAIRSVVVGEAKRTQVLALNHLTDPTERDAALRRWAATECPGTREVSWFELAGAASASLVVLALLTVASRHYLTRREIETVLRVYWPWMSLVAVMLDSYADQAEDAATGDHSYVAHYPTRARMVARLGECVRRACAGALSLPDGHRHAVLVGAMVAMYLSKDSARAPDMRPDSRALVRAGGSLAQVLFPVLRLWRIAYGLRAA